MHNSRQVNGCTCSNVLIHCKMHVSGKDLYETYCFDSTSSAKSIGFYLIVWNPVKNYSSAEYALIFCVVSCLYLVKLQIN